MKKFLKSIVALSLSVTMMGAMIGCSSSEASEDGKVVIYSNADEEAIKAIKNSLDNNGYENKYIVQSLGTSELGGKLLAEGKNIEADLITMSSYYVESAQVEHSMFADLDFDYKTLEEYPSYAAPTTSQEGTIIVNTKVLEEEKLEAPKSIKDLADKKYAGLISVPDIAGSSTAWLLVQDIISEYGEKEGKEILTKIIENAGPHLESSGSAPIKKVRAGEVGIAFGLRHQAVKDKEDGLPIDYIDPIEGNFELTESVAVVNKDGETKDLAMEMAKCIIENGRSELMETYPNALYEGEKVDTEKASAYPKKFKEKLTVELLKKHQEFSESCK